jgi:glycosyltransferase involved in cell wall biosynthesis
MWAPGVPAWSDVTVLDRRTMPRAKYMARLLRTAPRFDATILNGSARFHDLYQDLIAAVLLARRRRPPPIVMAETAWDLGSAPLSERFGVDRFGFASVARLGVKALDGDHVTYCVFSEEERDLFTTTFGIPRERVACVRFAHSLWSRADGPVGDRGYVFAGGDSLRDYGTLLAAIDGLDVPVRICTNNPLPSLPPNVSVGPVGLEAYNDLLAHARVVVVPVCAAVRRGAGLLTYLNAMALGKAVIVADTPAAREYVEHERTGILVPPEDPVALRTAIDWALDPANAAQVREMGRRARESVRHPNEYWQALRDVAERAARRAA